MKTEKATMGLSSNYLRINLCLEDDVFKGEITCRKEYFLAIGER